MPTTARHDANESARTVSELTREIKDQLENHYPDVWVTGEISNCRPARSGHVYLTLKDDQSQISAVIWRNTASRLPFELTDGLEVVAGASTCAAEREDEGWEEVEEAGEPRLLPGR